MQFSEYKNLPAQATVITNGGSDPFNYPMPNRADTMSLGTIVAGKDGMKTTTAKFLSKRFDSTNLHTKDIDGAIPKLHGSRQVSPDKFQFNLQNKDIDRSAPRNLHIGLQKPANNLRTDDIYGAKPQCVKFETSRIGQNPLNPNYKLQSVNYLAAEPTKFIRDQLDIDDIPGSRPAKKRQLDIATRDLMNIKDIEGTTARPRHFTRPNAERIGPYHPMDYRDVTNVDFKSTRTVNPLDPTYVTRDENKNVAQIGPIEQNKPCVLPPARQDENFTATSLKTTDIHGCKIGTKGLGNFHTRDRRAFLTTNTTTDIFGAQPGTLKKAPETKRQTHPLMPDYQMPGRLELTNINDAFGKKNASQQAILDRHMARDTSKTLQASAQQSLGIKDVSQLHSASREGAAASAKASEKSAQQSQKSAAQKLDSFIS